MAKADVISAAKAKFIQDQDAAIQAYGEACYDGGLAEAPAPAPAGFSQADIDAAVSAAKQVDAEAATQAKAASDAALADLQAKLQAMSDKEGQEEHVIAGLQGSVAQVQAALAAISALIPQG